VPLLLRITAASVSQLLTRFATIKRTAPFFFFFILFFLLPVLPVDRRSARGTRSYVAINLPALRLCNSAAALSYAFPVLKYKYINIYIYIYIYILNKIYGSNFIKRQSEVLWFEITKMLIAVLKMILLCYLL